MAQMKEQNKTPEKELNEMEINIYEKQSSKCWLSECSKKIIGYCNSIKMTQAEMKITLSEITKNL